MIGTKKLSDIKQSLRKSLAKDRDGLEAWLKDGLRKSKSKRASGSKVVEDLIWVRDLLREAVAETKKDAAKRRRPKKSPTA